MSSRTTTGIGSISAALRAEVCRTEAQGLAHRPTRISPLVAGMARGRGRPIGADPRDADSRHRDLGQAVVPRTSLPTRIRTLSPPGVPQAVHIAFSRISSSQRTMIRTSRLGRLRPRLDQLGDAKRELVGGLAALWARVRILLIVASGTPLTAAFDRKCPWPLRGRQGPLKLDSWFVGILCRFCEGNKEPSRSCKRCRDGFPVEIDWQ